ncbi:Two component regulator propeller [Granulicella pectinivorans]|uniref:Two component regulator propeller n=1 Tax=Granulicella pectinivorans TaxID=474950 RepID=A0A1I6M1E3_9BACT|nr:sensor histidine kinase [Granulicella pectinivorans]SFS09312.1 Two component regulator propeller [Granulicella pectinivorans]
MRLLRLVRWPLLLLLLIAVARGQGRPWAHEVWTTENGLPQNSVHAVVQGRDGFLWVATEGGLARFDGVGFAVFNRENTPAFTSDDLSSLVVDKDGALLVGSADGWVKYEDGVFRKAAEPDVTLPVGLGKPKGIPAGRVQATLRDARGGFWVGMDRGLYSPEGKVAAIGDASVLSLFEDREGDIWAGTDTGGLHVLRPQVFRGELLGKAVTAVTQGADGGMWAGTRGDGLFRVGGKHLTAKDGLLSDVVLSLAADRDGSLWVGTPDGLNHLLKGGKVEAMTSADGLPDDFVRSLYADRDGTLWIGTRRGLVHREGGRLTSVAGLPSDLIGAMVRMRGGDLWVGTLDGVARLRNGKVTAYGAKDGLVGSVVTSLVERKDGSLWVGTKDGGLSRLAGERFEGVLPGEVDDLVEDDRGGLWLTGSRGVMRVAEQGTGRFGAVSYGTGDGLPSEEMAGPGHPAAWKAVDGTVWLGTRKGLAVVDPAGLRGRVPVPAVVERFTVDDALWVGGEVIPPGHMRFAFEYAGLSFAAPSRVRYRYMLEGFDKGWVEAGGRRSAFYTNLGAGRYRFLVQAAGADGVWGESAVVAFRVKPRFYRTWWFLGLMVLVVGGLVGLGYWLRVRALRVRFDAILAERNRMAREVHDTLAQGFVGISLQLEVTGMMLAQGHVEGAKKQVDETKALVREGLADARQSIWELRSGAVDGGLPERMRSMVDRLKTESVRVELAVGGTYRALEPELEREVMRVAQEAVTNAVRHARAGLVVVDLRYQPVELTLAVRDDGAGFAPEQVASGRFGLVGMRERAERIGGRLEIESSAESGTVVRLRVPLVA